MKKINIFEYLDYRKMLHDLFIWYQKKNPNFSHRYFAQRAGFSASGNISLIISGKRNLTKSSILKIARGFKFSDEELGFFENLVFMNQSKTLEDKDYYYKKLFQTKKFAKIHKLKQHHYDFYSHWYNCVIRELAVHNNGKITAKEIADKIFPEISVKEVRKSLMLLEKLGLLIKKNNRFLLSQSFLTTGPEITSVLVAKYHKQMIELAKQSIENFKSNERDVSSLTLNIPKNKFQVIKKKINIFRKELMDITASFNEPDSVIQINIQAFPLTRVLKPR